MEVLLEAQEQDLVKKSQSQEVSKSKSQQELHQYSADHNPSKIGKREQAEAAIRLGEIMLMKNYCKLAFWSHFVSG